MKLVRFTQNGRTRIGKVEGELVVDLSGVEGVTDSMRTLITELETLKPSLESAQGETYPLNEVKLEAPINDPQKYLAIGMNYKAHVEESDRGGHKAPPYQLWFNKQVSCINGPYDAIERPVVSVELDYEAELAFVVGKKCKNVSKDDALSVIAGYMVSNDVTVRDWQHRTPTYTLGKSFDTHGPIGPWLTTADEIEDPEALDIALYVNGVERQRSNTSQLIYKIADQIAYLSTVLTLYPGDIIATGTPSGVAAVDQNWMKPGDTCRVEIEKLGFIENPIVQAEK